MPYGIPGYDLDIVLHHSVRVRVYRGRRQVDGVPVVLKAPGVDHPPPQQLARFENERGVLRHLVADGVVRLLDTVHVGPHEALVFRDRGGSSLRQHFGGRVLERAEFLDLALAIVRALEAVHAQQLIHRDLNPTNIVLTEAGQVEIIDFGLAIAVMQEQPAFNGDAVEGTLNYISPEQTGRVQRGVDYRTDYYALGATFYELLLGRPPFEAADALELIHCHLARRPEPPFSRRPELGEAVSELVMKLLAKTPEDRYQSIPGLLHDLEQCRTASAGFSLGGRDRPPRLIIPNRLYGRDDALSSLRDAYDTAAAGTFRVALLCGRAGVGKSALLHTFLSEVAHQGGLTAAGKCDEPHRAVPCFALAEALAALVPQLLASPEAQAQQRRVRMAAALGENGQLLLEVVPELQAVIGPQPALGELPPMEAVNRHLRVLAQFLHSLSSAEQPLVIFLDDMQWSDDVTLRLLHVMRAEPAEAPLLMVLGWRDDEPDEALQAALGDLQEVTCCRLHLQDVETPHIARLLSDTLHCTEDQCRELTGLVAARTGGNPFFMRQFLETLHRDGLIVAEESGWVWDLERLEHAEMTSNVAELVARRVRALPQRTLDVLQAASCVGDRSDVGALAAATGWSEDEVYDHVRPAMREGLVRYVGGEIRFMHDRVRHAVVATLNAERRACLHLSLARHLRRDMKDTEGDERLFDLAQHLQAAAGLLTAEERDDAARVNLHAARRASRVAGWSTARVCLEAARACLGADGWTRQRPMMVTVLLEAAVVASMSGAPERTREITEEVLERADSVLDRGRAMDVLLGAHIMRAHYAEALEYGYETLALLGENPPRSCSRASAALILGRAVVQFSGNTVESLARLPDATDPLHRLIARVLARVSIAAFMCRPELVLPFSVRQVERAIRYGINEESSNGLAAYGVIQAVVLGNPALGDRIGRMALQLAERFPAGPERHRTWFVAWHMIRHWCSPMRPIVERTDAMYRACIESGDYESAQLMAWARCRMAYQAGIPLSVVGPDLDRLSGEVTALCGKAPPLQWVLQREVIDALQQGAALLPHLQEGLDSGNTVVVWTAAYEQAWLHLLLGQAEAALPYLSRLEPFQDVMIGLPEIPHFHYLCALVRIAACPRKARRAIEKSLSRLRRFADNCSANYAHRYHLVRAEQARSNGDEATAVRAYDEAAASAQENGYLQDAAFALERAGTLHLAAGRERVARVYLSDARHLWERWGARALVARLDQQYPTLLATTDHTGSGTGSSSSSSSSQLDMLAVMKATQAISGEIILDRLLERLLSITIESAGAQRAFLILERDGQLTVEADGDVDRTPVLQVSSRSLGEDLATGVVRYVMKTQSAVVLHEATSDVTFAADPYVRERRPRSILCLPIVTQGKQCGVLYVENNHITHAFTAERQQVLRLLSGQAAISLENARLYASLDEHRRTLEARVAERTEALQRQNERLDQARDQIITQQKLAYLGTLTAGIAHEIRNPLNFVSNSAVISSDLVDEAGELLQQVSEHPVREQLEELLGSVGTNSQKIREHAARAERVVQGMLLHAGNSSGEREACDLNTLVVQSANLARHGAKSRGARSVEVTVSSDPSLPPVDGAPRDLARAFLNVIGNAVLAAAERGQQEERFAPLVVISVSHTDTLATVRVRDNGNGITPDLRDKIFAPFFTTRPAGEGTGLGLSITYDIVVGQHGGRLDVKSEPGEYAEFIIDLPLKAVDA